MHTQFNQARAADLEAVDPIWASLRAEAEAASERDPTIGALCHTSVLAQPSLEAAVSHRVAHRLASEDVGPAALVDTFRGVIADEPGLGLAFRADLAAVYDRDPAVHRYMEPLLYYKGFHALVTHRFAHAIWNAGRRDLALYLQSQSSKMFAVDINPAAKMGLGIMLDHAHGFVVGETAEIGDNVSILHGVTLGGTGKESGDRHPKVGNNVLIGAGAKVLGNIKIGDCSRIGAGSVVLQPVPECTTVAGVPARVVGPAGCPEPARTMDQLFPTPDTATATARG